MTALLLALLAGVGWGASDFCGGLSARRLSLPVVLAGSQLVGLLAFAPILIGRRADPPTDPRLLLALAAGAISVGELGLVYLALRSGPNVVTAPIAALSAALPVAVGVSTGDRIDAVMALGLACALIGAAATSWSPATPGGRGNPFPGLLLAATAALGAGGFLVLMSAASGADPWRAVGAVRLGGSVTALGWFVWSRAHHSTAAAAASPTTLDRSSPRPGRSSPCWRSAT